MGLKDKISILDRNNLGTTGPTVGTTEPSDGGYFTQGGTSDSPFNSTDHMVDLLSNDVTSTNQPNITHKKGNHDLDGVEGPIFGDAGGQGKQLGGVDLHEAMLTQAYTNNSVTVGPSPGPSGNSLFQDMNGSTTDFGEGFSNPLTGNYMGRYKNPDTGAVY